MNLNIYSKIKMPGAQINLLNETQGHCPLIKPNTTYGEEREKLFTLPLENFEIWTLQSL